MQNISKCWLDFAYLWHSVVAVQNRIYMYVPLACNDEAYSTYGHRIFVPDKPFIPYRTAGFTVAHTFHIIGTRSCYCMRKCVLLLNDKNNNNAKKE